MTASPKLVSVLVSAASCESHNPLVPKQLKGGGEGRNRTDECSFCRAVPYHLATPPDRVELGEDRDARKRNPTPKSNNEVRPDSEIAKSPYPDPSTVPGFASPPPSPGQTGHHELLRPGLALEVPQCQGGSAGVAE